MEMASVNMVFQGNAVIKQLSAHCGQKMKGEKDEKTVLKAFHQKKKETVPEAKGLSILHR